EQETNVEQEIPELHQAEEADPAADTNLPECPSHEASVFSQGKPRSILSLPVLQLKLLESFYIVMH
ncbi:hypothetical protein, partial [Haemophilus sp. SZY H54]